MYAEDNEETIKNIFQTHIKNSLSVSEKRLMMQIEDFEVKKFLNEIEEVFNEAMGKGLFSDN
jgi:hypothetical protein